MTSVEDLLKESIKPAVQFLFGRTLAEFILICLLGGVGYGMFWFTTIGQPDMVNTINNGHEKARADFREEMKLQREDDKAERKELREIMVNLGLASPPPPNEKNTAKPASSTIATPLDHRTQ